MKQAVFEESSTILKVVSDVSSLSQKNKTITFVFIRQKPTKDDYFMETASLSEIKKELKVLSPQQLQEVLLRLAKYKKENKELLSYLLFEAFNQKAFIQSVKEEIDEQFMHLNRSSFYLAKKTLRKALRTTKKYIRFSGSKETEIELLIYFCQKMKKSGLQMGSSRVVMNMYINQVRRIKQVLSMMHEDLQMDYDEAVKRL